jgi:hypothetical protein
VKTNAAGQAVFRNLIIPKPGKYKFTARSAGLGSAATAMITIFANAALQRRYWR